MKGQRFTKSTSCFPKPKVAGSNPAGRITQATEDKAVTTTGELNNKVENQNIVSDLFLKSEIDTPELPADQDMIVAARPGLPELIKVGLLKHSF